MKKITLLVISLISFTTFAQKDEFKKLKKIYAKETPSSSDIEDFKSTLKSLETLVSTEEDKVYKNFYEGMCPLMEVMALGAKVTPQDQLRIFNPTALNKFTNSVNETLEFEKKSGKKIYTDDINETLGWFIPQMEQAAFQLNEAKQYAMASQAFYNLYKLDNESGSSLLNAAILSAQVKDFPNAIKLYEEYRDSNYLKNGFVYYATNKLNDEEESFISKKARKTKLDLMTHEKPRDEKVLGRNDILKTIANLKGQSKDIEGAKIAYKDAINEFPNDLNLLIDEANFYYNQNDLVTYRNLIKEIVKKDPTNALLYFNIGYLGLADDVKLVEEINKNLDNVKVYDQLITKRKAMYQSALPYLEESYKLDPSSENTINVLKSTYQVLGMKDKADKL